MNITKRTIPTTNYDTSRKPIKTIFIHWIVGNLASADTRFRKEGEQASAHYGIEDNNIYQWVDEANTAYAVGVYTINQESISIEHSASLDRLASDSTYTTSAKLIAEICKRHNIPLDRTHIRGHNEVKATQCPGTIDINRIIKEAKSLDFPEDSSNIDIQNISMNDQFRIPGRLLSSQDHPVNEEFLELQQIRSVFSEFGRLKESHIGALRNLETKEKELATAKGTIRIRDETINDLAIKLEKLQSSLDMPPEPAEAPENTGNETQQSNFLAILINQFVRILKRLFNLE